MVTLLIYLGFGILNATDSYNKGILMLATPEHRGLEAWAEAVLYVLLWPLQVLYYTYGLVVDFLYRVQVRVLAWWMR